MKHGVQSSGGVLAGRNDLSGCYDACFVDTIWYTASSWPCQYAHAKATYLILALSQWLWSNVALEASCSNQQNRRISNEALYSVKSMEVSCIRVASLQENYWLPLRYVGKSYKAVFEKNETSDQLEAIINRFTELAAAESTAEDASRPEVRFVRMGLDG